MSRHDDWLLAAESRFAASVAPLAKSDADADRVAAWWVELRAAIGRAAEHDPPSLAPPDVDPASAPAKCRVWLRKAFDAAVRDARYDDYGFEVPLAANRARWCAEAGCRTGDVWMGWRVQWFDPTGRRPALVLSHPDAAAHGSLVARFYAEFVPWASLRG